jgi:cellulose synthase/poly-beta-1,6-N-acetylglucosamine synthase-like glycosyltransferase
VVTGYQKIDDIEYLLEQNNLSLDKVEVLAVEEVRRRGMIVEGVKKVETQFTFFAEDDVIWPPQFLIHMLACFEDPTVGAAGPVQRVKRSETPSLWHFLGAAYLERRKGGEGAANFVDGGLSTLSRRTSAFRTSILKKRSFYEEFLRETLLNKEDMDHFLDRWVLREKWGIKLQFSNQAMLETMLEENKTFISQYLEWSRAHWRGKLQVMRGQEEYWWR